MRHHGELEGEEVFWLGVRILLGLINLRPYLVQVLVQHRLESGKLDATIVVTEHEEQLLRHVLVEELEVHLEDDLEEAVI